jgi:hypothetical protein
MIIMVVVAIGVVLVLGIVAFRLQSKVKAMEAEKKAQLVAFEKQTQEKRESMNKSIQILAQGVQENQLSKTEAAIRIGALLEFLGVDNNVKEEFSAFFQLAEATAHIPILDKWKSLPTKEKLRYDNERVLVEEKYGDFVADAAKRIIGRAF